MTERSLGNRFKWFVAKVVNRGDGKKGEKDKTESGRVQIRIYGKHDDEKNIPDDKLPWAVPLLPIGSGASKNGVGSTPVGLQNGSTVVGFYADHDESIPVLFGVLHKAGKDKNNSDGVELDKEKNDLPKGARTKDTGGKDENDVLKKRITEDVAKKDQLHVTKKTIGSVPFDGSQVLDVIKKADPNNLAGSIQGALNGAKSLTNTLASANILMNNFNKLVSGQMSLQQILKLATTVATVANNVKQVVDINKAQKQQYEVTFSDYNILITIHKDVVTGTYANVVVQLTSTYDVNGNISAVKGILKIANNLVFEGDVGGLMLKAQSISTSVAAVVEAVRSANISNTLGNNAFSGQNPLQNILQAMGSINALISQASGLLGQLTGSFGAAIAIANNLRSTTQSLFKGVQAAPIPKSVTLSQNIPNILPNIGNIAGISASTAQAAAILGQATQLTSQLTSTFNAALSTPNSLLNNVIQVPNINLGVINQLSLTNPGTTISVNNNTYPTVTQRGPSQRGSFQITPNYSYNNATSGISSLENSSISVSFDNGVTTGQTRITLRQNVGVNFNISGTLINQIGT